jgi:hypothetical protein
MRAIAIVDDWDHHLEVTFHLLTHFFGRMLCGYARPYNVSGVRAT